MRRWVRQGAAALILAVAPAEASPEPLPVPGPAPQPAPAPPPSPFPSPEELERLGEPPPAEAVRAMDVRTVDSFRLEGPFPDQVGALPYSDPSPWGGLLDAAARRRAGLVLPTDDMHCAARELGRFYLAHRGQPAESLRRFITARCRATVARVSVAWVSGDVPAQADEARIFELWKDGVAENLETHLGGGPRTAGIWFGREGDHAIALVASGLREVHVEPFSPRVDASGRVELQGEALGPVESVGALVNRGRFQVAACESIGEPKPPRFHFSCEIAPSDEAALVAVGLRRPGRLLTSSGLDVLVTRGDAKVADYRRPSYGEPRPVAAAGEVPGVVTELLNRVREEAGLGPVSLDPAQSEAATRLAPYFFAAAHGNAAGLDPDLLVLGMLAGWSVDGLVEEGHFTAGAINGSTDLAALLGVALEYPVSRAALLDAEIDRIAVGPVLDAAPEDPWVAAMFGTYALFASGSHDEMAGRVYERLEAERAERGLEPPERLADVASLCHEAASAVQQGVEPADALNGLLRASAQALGRPVAGWIAEAGEIEELEFPEEYLADPNLAVAVAVTHRRPEGEPWGRYVVLVVFAEAESRGT